MEPVLKLDNVEKFYQKHHAVKGVSFEVPQGCLFGLLGPNGAGKTSIIRIITNITRADTGVVYFNGEKLNREHPKEIGYMPEERGLYKKMGVEEHLVYLCRLKGMNRVNARAALDYWFDRFQIEDWRSKKVEELSKGMQQKIQFIATVIHKPKLLILDEPFSGLDPINTNLIRDEIDELNRNGTSIIFSTHRMAQVEEICERIVLINRGQNVLNGTVKDIIEEYKENKFKLAYSGMLPDDIEAHFNVLSKSDNEIIVQFEQGQNSNELLNFLAHKEAHIHSFNEQLPSLNEVFIKRVGDTSDE